MSSQYKHYDGTKPRPSMYSNSQQDTYTCNVGCLCNFKPRSSYDTMQYNTFVDGKQPNLPVVKSFLGWKKI